MSEPCPGVETLYLAAATEPKRHASLVFFAGPFVATTTIPPTTGDRSPSTYTMKMALSPQFFRSVRQLHQNLAPSVSLTQRTLAESYANGRNTLKPRSIPYSQ